MCFQYLTVYYLLLTQVELPESAPLFKEGYIRKKNIMDAPHKKVPRGKRQWKPYYVFLKGFLMYFVPVSLFVTCTYIYNVHEFFIYSLGVSFS